MHAEPDERIPPMLRAAVRGFILARSGRFLVIESMRPKREIPIGTRELDADCDHSEEQDNQRIVATDGGGHDDS